MFESRVKSSHMGNGSCFLRKHHRAKEEDFMLKNGAAMLERLITLFDGKCCPCRIYSIEELNKATNYFHCSGVLIQDWNSTTYKGVHEGRQVSVKMFKPTFGLSTDSLGLVTNEIAIASQMSKHKNVLKLLGYCLQAELPLLVYEFPANGNLSDYIDGNCPSLPWKTKLRIASGIAHAVAYLHHGLSKTIIHRDITYGRIFLDCEYAAKLSEFQVSVPIPAGETHVVEEVFVSHGFAAPELEKYGRHTEQSDVYAFGILLSEILTGKRYDALKWASEISKGTRSNPVVAESRGKDLANLCGTHLKVNYMDEENSVQVMECAKLVERCLAANPSDRTDMIRVAKALCLISNIA